MVTKDIELFSQIRTKARAYFCYLLQRHIPNYTIEPAMEPIIDALKILKKELPMAETFYVLDKRGITMMDAISTNKEYRTGKGNNRSSRAYFYRAVREKRCIVTDPYPSIISHNLTVTASYPVYDEHKHLHYVVCIDISLKELLKFFHPSSADTYFGIFSKISYGMISVSLFVVAFLLFAKGVGNIAHYFSFETIEIRKMFEATILITLALAIFDLVKTIFEEEVLGAHQRKHTNEMHNTMVKFLGSIIIALSIEALMMVFKYSLMGPEKLVYAILLIFGVTMLLYGLSYYLKNAKDGEDEE